MILIDSIGISINKARYQMLGVQCVWLPSPPVLTQKVSTVLSPQREGYHSIANGTLCRWEFQTLLSSTIVPSAAQTLPQNQVTTHL